MSDSRIEGYARALFEIARAEGTLDEVEDELFRFARSYESSDELRNALDRRADPGRASARRSSRTCSAARPPDHDAARSRWWSAPVAARDLPAIIDKLVAAGSSAKNLEVAEVRSAVAAHRRPADAARRRPRQRHRQAGQPQGRRRPVRARRHRGHRRRHRHRRHRPHPNRPVEVPPLGPEHGDITNHGRTHAVRRRHRRRAQEEPGGFRAVARGPHGRARHRGRRRHRPRQRAARTAASTSCSSSKTAPSGWR